MTDDLHPAARELADALIAADDARPRTQQLGPGFSSLGSCARRVWHEIREDQPCNNTTKRLPAILGTIFHNHIDGMLSGFAEVELRLEEINLPGTADRIHDGILDDFKTTTLKNIDWVREHGPGRQKRWQVHSYAYAWNTRQEAAMERNAAAGLLMGRAPHPVAAPVHTVRLIFVPRDGTEDDVLVWEEPYDRQAALDAMDWFDQIRQYAEDNVPVAPEKDPAFCADWCPFFGALCPGKVAEKGPDAPPVVSDDPWLAEAVKAYAEASAAASKADDAKKAAREALEGFTGRVPGYTVTWVHRAGSQVPDRDAITQQLGHVPMRTGKPSVYPLVKKVP